MPDLVRLDLLLWCLRPRDPVHEPVSVATYVMGAPWAKSKLQKRAGTAMVWPPQWVESSGPGHTSAVAEEGVLEGLQRLDNRLLLEITIDGRPAHGQQGVGSASSRRLVKAAGYAVEAVRCR